MGNYSNALPWWMVKQLWYIHIAEYCLVFTKNKLLIHATIWITQENYAEISQFKKDMYYMILPL